MRNHNALNRWLLHIIYTAVLLLHTFNLHAETMPACPTAGTDPFPTFGEISEPPHFAVWHDLSSIAETCLIPIKTPAEVTVALAAKFTHSGSINELAARMGEISKMKNLKYWSVTDKSWRKLVSKSVALSTQKTNAKRLDFTASEVLSGETIYFAQSDTRSWGLNTYSLKTASASADHMVLLSENISSIGLGPVTIFKPNAVQTLLMVSHVDDTTWSYYSLAIIKDTTIAANEKSLINRQAALYRFFIGQAADQEPPLAP